MKRAPRANRGALSLRANSIRVQVGAGAAEPLAPRHIAMLLAACVPKGAHDLP